MPTHIPFSFVLERLLPLKPEVRRMFGCHAVYTGDIIVLVLRQRADHPEANGVWVATTMEHHASLKKSLPSLRSVYLLSDGVAETNWQMIPVESESFEEEVINACE